MFLKITLLALFVLFDSEDGLEMSVNQRFPAVLKLLIVACFDTTKLESVTRDKSD